ncbi:MAG TPA: hypothetical protein GX702_03975, partial [Chloroflexi bacterium]|nr:hypothetical protein [Chloroflexota bacterium]
ERIAAGAEVVPLPEKRVEDGRVTWAHDRACIHRSGEFAFPIIVAMTENRHQFIEAVNIRNDGAIANLPPWAVVEVPAVAGADGLRAVQGGELPDGIAALLNTQVHVQDLVVEAAVHGSRDLALQALLADPVVQSARAAEACLDELLTTHAPYLPRFR